MSAKYFIGIMLGLYFFIANPLFADQNEPVFLINSAELRTVSYPWWDELYLYVTGSTHPICENTALSLSVYYNKSVVASFNMIIVKKSDTSDASSSWINFEQEWGPLNQAVQEIVPGTYTVEAHLNLQAQSSDFRQAWQQRFPGKIPQNYQQRIKRGSDAELVKESEQEKRFYIARMKTLNGFFQELNTTKQKFLQAYRDKRGGKQNQLAVWETWLKTELWPKIMAEKELLEKHRQKKLGLRYPLTHDNMKFYCSILIELSRFMSGQLATMYSSGQKSPKNAAMSSDFFSDLRSFIQQIQQLHGQSALEMKISLRQELGYLPPPGVSR